MHQSIRATSTAEDTPFLVKVLGALKPAYSILQSHSVDLCSAGDVISASLQALKDMHADSTWDQTNETNPTPERKRQRTMSKQLGDGVVLSTIGHGDLSEMPTQSLKRALLNILKLKTVSQSETLI